MYILVHPSLSLYILVYPSTYFSSSHILTVLVRNICNEVSGSQIFDHNLVPKEILTLELLLVNKTLNVKVSFQAYCFIQVGIIRHQFGPRHSVKNNKHVFYLKHIYSKAFFCYLNFYDSLPKPCKMFGKTYEGDFFF